MVEQGWRSGESTRLPPMWPGFNSRRRRDMWVEFVVGSLPCSVRFFSSYSSFPGPLLKNQHFQIPIRPGIRETKNHYLDVLPVNRYLFILFCMIRFGILCCFSFNAWLLYFLAYKAQHFFNESLLDCSKCVIISWCVI